MSYDYWRRPTNRTNPRLSSYNGVRRIGKTELVKQFIKEKEHVYFLADTRVDKDNIREMQRAI